MYLPTSCHEDSLSNVRDEWLFLSHFYIRHESSARCIMQIRYYLSLGPLDPISEIVYSVMPSIFFCQVSFLVILFLQSRRRSHPTCDFILYTCRLLCQSLLSAYAEIHFEMLKFAVDLPGPNFLYLQRLYRNFLRFFLYLNFIHYQSKLWDHLSFDDCLNYLNFNSVSDKIFSLN